MRPVTDDTRYAYAVARIRGMETGLLDRQWIERLLAETADGALKVLGDSAFQEATSGVDRPQDVEEGLLAALTETLTVVSRIAPKPELIDLFRVRWDFRNLRSLIKASLLKVPAADIGLARGPGTIDVAGMEKAVSEGDYASMPGVLSDAAREAQDDYRDHGELARVDHVLDSAMWEHQLAVAIAHGESFLEAYFRTEIDLINIRTFARVKQVGGDTGDLGSALIEGGHLERSFFAGYLGEPMEALARGLEYGRYGSLADVFRDWSQDRAHALDRACDNVLLDVVDEAARQAYGIEPLVAFVLVKQLEIKLVRAAMVAKLDGVGRDVVEERMRTIHA
jgi:V/A-type H+-transporting ATPase subunit C